MGPGNLLMDWVSLEPDSPGVGRSIADLAIRQRTGMTVVAIVRDDTSITAPDPSEMLQASDRLVVVGRRRDFAAPDPSEMLQASDRLVVVGRRRDFAALRDLLVG